MKKICNKCHVLKENKKDQFYAQKATCIPCYLSTSNKNYIKIKTPTKATQKSEEIRRLLATGMKSKDIAKEVGLTDMQIKYFVLKNPTRSIEN